MDHNIWKSITRTLSHRSRLRRSKMSADRRARSWTSSLESLESRQLLATVLGTGSAALLGRDLTDVDDVHNEGAYSPPGNFGGFDARFFSSDEPGFGGGESAFNVFDNAVGGGNDKWCCGSSFPQIVGAEFSQAVLLTHFTVASGNDTAARRPRVWTIDGSNDGENWTTIFSQNNPNAPVWNAHNQVIRFDAGDDFPVQAAAYTHLRMKTLATGAVGGGFFQVNEIEFFGDVGLTVVGSTPEDGAILGSSPAVATIEFGLDYKPSTVDAGDLTVDGQSATGFRLIDAKTIEFDLPAVGGGEHTLAIAAGVIEAQQAGLPAVLPFSSTFIIPAAPTVINTPASNIGAFGAQVGAEVIDTGGDEPEVFIYWGDAPGGTNPGTWDGVIPLGTGDGALVSGLSNLVHNRQYYYRAFASNAAGSAWASNTATFTTLPLTLPAIATEPISTIGAFAAEVSGRVTDTGGDVPSVTIFFGTSDGGTDKLAWDSAIGIGERVDEFSVTVDGLRSETQYFVRALAANAAGESWSAVSRSFTTIDAPLLQISELMAKNDSTLTTRTRASAGDAFRGEQKTPDWIEIENLTSQAVDIGGTHLTNNRGDETQWRFPAGTTIPARGRLVVFASGQNILDPALDEKGFLHTNFSLDVDGEYLALTSGDGTVIHEYAPGFPFQIADVSYGIHTGQFRYFATPTPGAANSSNFTDLVADTTFSVDRGFYDAAFEVEINSKTPDATIRYTLDGTPPSETRGTIYSGPITINKTTTLRAMAFKPGFESTNVDTQTYLFLADVVKQSRASTIAAGFPSSWGRFSSDYGIDTDVVGPNDRFGGRYVDRIFDSLTSIPTLSLVMNIDDMFGSSGIYTNATSSGPSWERATSVELIQPDGGGEFQIDAGIRIQGGAFRGDGLTKKHGLRLLFKNIYGDSKLRFPLFGDDATDRFDTITLRPEANDGWSWSAAGGQPQYARDEFGRRVQLAMGQPSSHGNRVHLYINGIYWGVYNPVERPDAGFAASYFDVPKEDWDGINSGKAINASTDSARRNRTLTAWGTLLSRASAVAGARDEDARTAAFQRIQGNNPDGTPNESIPDYLDVDNMIDYLIVNYYGGNADWPRKNYYVGRDSGPDSTGFKFFMWDAEWSLFLRSNNGASLINNGSGVAAPFQSLRASAEFRLQFADRVHQHLFNGGALYVDPANRQWDPDHPERNVPAAIYMSVIDEVRDSLVAESARWGDQHRSTPYTPDAEWQSELNRLLTSWFPNRSRDLLNLFRQTNLYPSVDATTFSQHGGEIESGFPLSMTAPGGGTIYYTTDGSDPRVQGGAVAPGASRYDGAVTLNISSQVKSRVLRSGQWSALNEATFLVPVPTITVSEIQFNPAGKPGSGFDNDEFEFIEIYNYGDQTADLSGVQFVGGVHFDFASSEVTSLAAGEYAVVVRNLSAFSDRYDAGAIRIAGQFQLDSKLDNSGEKIELRDTFGQEIAVFSYKDNWYSLTDGDGFSLSQTSPDDTAVDLDIKAAWQPSSRLHGSPGTADSGEAPAPGSIIFNELLTRTGVNDNDVAGDAIELFNRSGAAINIGGWFLSNDAAVPAKYEIAPGTMIQADGFVVLREEQQFGNPDAPGASEVFSLSQFGGQLTLTASDATGLLGFRQRRSFGPSALGVSFGEHITSDGTSDFVAMASQSLGTANSLPLVGPVVINEIMYNPASRDSGEDGAEFVELRNISDVAVSLAGWSFAGIGFEFPAGATIGADELVLVTPLDPAEFLATQNVPAGAAIFGPYIGSLSNGGESLRLFRPGDEQPNGMFPEILVDRVRYDDKAPWPVEADGGGPALQRIEPDQYGNDAENWAASLDRGTPGDLIIPPQVTAVLLSGQQWSETFVDALAAAGLGEVGYSIPGGAAQFVTLPWSNVDRLHLQFSEHVEVSSAALSLVGVNASNHEIVDFEYDAQRFIATWTLASPLRAERLLFELSDSVVDASGLPLDGNWTSGVDQFPSGNGAIDSGDAFRFRINVVAGDVDADGKVTRGDLLATVRRVGLDTSDERYSPRLDVNADGQIDVRDVREVLSRQSVGLPSGEPSFETGAAAVAVDAIFVRLGPGPSPQRAFTLPRSEPDEFSAIATEVAHRRTAGRASPAVIRSGGSLSIDSTPSRRRALSARHAEAVDLAISSLPEELPSRRLARRRSR
ncbi:MAG: lamin tail domain-containing protein [Planctomycetes bacterium]|nr:lamin tail domain-containing protein [Planctomycetota bacterium]